MALAEQLSVNMAYYQRLPLLVSFVNIRHLAVLFYLLAITQRDQMVILVSNTMSAMAVLPLKTLPMLSLLILKALLNIIY